MGLLHNAMIGAMLIASPFVSAETLYKGGPHDLLYGACVTSTETRVVGDASLMLLSGLDQPEFQIVSGNPLALPSNSKSPALLDIACSEKKAIAVGQEGAIWVDGVGVESPTAERLFSISLNQVGEAAVVGSFGVILFSGDEGENWQVLSPDWGELLSNGMEPHLYGVHLTDHGHLYAVGEFGLVLFSPDKGESWQKLHEGEASLFDLALDENGVLFAVGQSGEMLSIALSEGTTAKQKFDEKQHLTSVYVHEDRVLIAGGHSLWFRNLNAPDSRWCKLAYQGQGLSQPWVSDVVAKDEGYLLVGGNQVASLVLDGKCDSL